MPVTDTGVAALGHPERIAGLIGDGHREGRRFRWT
jgi:hypothetical protein